MIDVYLSGPAEEVGQLELLGNKVQSHFRFGAIRQPGAVMVELRPELRERLLSVSRGLGVEMSLDQSDGISRYAGIPRPLYLLCCAVLGLVYWRVLELNPLLVWEDLFVREEPECLCSARATLPEYALAFERPWVCPACLEFFRCTGVEPETAVLQDVLAQVSVAQNRSLTNSSK